MGGRCVTGSSAKKLWCAALIAAATCSSFVPAAVRAAEVAAGPARVLRHEPFTLSAPPGAGSTQNKTSSGGVTGASFNAYGRRFDLTLEKNSRLATAVAAVSPESTGAAQNLYRGSIDGVPGSWVRLSAKGQTVRGMIWDGQDLYVVELADQLHDASDTALQAPAGSTVIFKLADAQIEDGASFCEASDNVGVQKGSDAYKSMMKELAGMPAIMQATGATVRLELSVLGDVQFRTRYATEQQARDEILLRLNNVDGIFTSQLGVEIQVPSLQILDATTDTFSATTAASTLLDELGALRSQSAALRSRGLTHLFTGRNLDGNTVGIAYQGTLCRQQYGAGLTEATGRGSWIESLIAAHEIGHNFGAPHDGDAECAGTQQNVFLMSPSVNAGASTFSQCSLSVMRPKMQNASCVVSLPPANLSVPADLGAIRQPVTLPFEWTLAVTNTGGSVARGSRVDLLVPPAVSIDDAWVPGGTCTTGGGAVACLLGDVPGNTSRVVHLTLHSNVVGTNSISAHVTSQNDAQTSNNDGSGSLLIEASADLSVALQSAASIASGASVTANFSASNLSAIDAVTVNVEFTLTHELAAASAQLSGGSCFVQAQSFRCTLPALAAGSTVDGSIVINGVSAGAGSVQAKVLSSDTDPNTDNDVAVRTITVTQAAAAPATTAAPSGGGGGSTGGGMLLGMLALLAMRRKSIDT